MVKKSNPAPRRKKLDNEVPKVSKTPAPLAAPLPPPAKDSTPSPKKRTALPKKSEDLGVQKEFLKNMDLCKVTFRLPHAAIWDEKKVCIVGDFNEWNTESSPMKKQKNGDFTITLNLKTGRSYHYRFLIDGCRWENDWKADRYEKNVYGNCDNSVVDIYKP